MEELGAWGVGCVVVLVVIAFILTALGWVFVSLATVLGHPIMVAAILIALGAYGGVIRYQRKNPSAAAVSDDDYATIASLRLLPIQWATLISLSLAAVVGLYGLIVL